MRKCCPPLATNYPQLVYTLWMKTQIVTKGLCQCIVGNCASKDTGEERHGRMNRSSIHYIMYLDLRTQRRSLCYEQCLHRQGGNFLNEAATKGDFTSKGFLWCNKNSWMRCNRVILSNAAAMGPPLSISGNPKSSERTHFPRIGLVLPLCYCQVNISK